MVNTIKHNIYESVETFIRIVGLYLGVVPPACIHVLSNFILLWHIYSIIHILSAIIYIVIDSKIHCLMCVDTWCGARLGGSKSNAINLILRLFLYHFLHTMSS
jgi:hypothetical protein